MFRHRRWYLLFSALICFSALSPVLSAPKNVSVKDFGAVGDGTTDDTAAIRKALEAAGDGGIVRVPPGQYLISDSLNIPSGCTLMGEGARWENGSAALVIRKNDFRPVLLNHVSAIKGLGIHYPDNKNDLNPKEYPPSITLNGINPTVEQIHFDCAWIGISTPDTGANTGQGMFRDITGFTHHIGMRLHGCRDVNRIQDVHWFVGGDNHSPDAYFMKNRVGFEFGDVDGVMMDRCFIIGGKTFFHKVGFKKDAGGKENPIGALGFQIDECWIENVDTGFIFDGVLGFTLENSNILVRNGGTGVKIRSAGLYYNSVISGVQVRGFGGPITGIEYDVVTPHVRNRLSIADCQVPDGDPAVHLMSGARRVNLHDCHLEGKLPVKIDKGADFLVITNNVFTCKGKAIEDGTDKEVTKNISGNLVEKVK